MPIYVDELFHAEPKKGFKGSEQARRVSQKNNHQWCHMWADPWHMDKLHLLAKRIHMKREWFQEDKRLPHYDLVPGKRARAVQFGVQVMPVGVYLRKRQKLLEEAMELKLPIGTMREIHNWGFYSYDFPPEEVGEDVWTEIRKLLASHGYGLAGLTVNRSTVSGYLKRLQPSP